MSRRGIEGGPTGSPMVVIDRKALGQKSYGTTVSFNQKSRSKSSNEIWKKNQDDDVSKNNHENSETCMPGAT